MNNRTVVNLDYTDTISYLWKHEKWGRAEFSICPIFRRNKLVDLWIDPIQQENKNLYHLQLASRNFQLKLDRTIVSIAPWLYHYCADHKCTSFRVYVPDNTNKLSFYVGTTVELIFS
jgi:hypothetical protein